MRSPGSFAAFFGAAFLLAACGTEVQHIPGDRSELVVNLRAPPLQNPFQDVGTLRLTLRDPEGAVWQQWELDGSASEALVDGEPVQDVTLRVEGLLDDLVISSGQSAAFDLQPGQPAAVDVLFARVGELTPLLGNLSQARFGHTATVLGDGRVLIVGGAQDGDLDSPGVLAQPEMYDPATQTSCLLGAANCAPGADKLERYGHAACASFEGDAFIHGGRDGDGELVSEFLVFRHDGDAWQEVQGFDLADVPARTHHAMSPVWVFTSSKILLAGGLGEGGVTLSDAAYLDAKYLTFNREGIPLGRARQGHSLSLIGTLGSRLALAGGRNLNGLVAEVEVFDGTSFADILPAGELASNRLSTPRLHHASVTVGSDVYILGGDDGIVSLDAPELLTLGNDPLGTGVISLLVSVAHAGHRLRRGAAAAPLPSGAVLWLGGESLDGFDREQLDSSERLIPEESSNQVSFVDAGAGRLSPPLSFPAVAVLPGGGVLLLGGLSPGVGDPVASDEVWYYNPR